MNKTSVFDILYFIITLLLFFVILLLICLTKFELIQFEYYIIISLSAIAVNMFFLEFSSETGFSFKCTIRCRLL